MQGGQCDLTHMLLDDCGIFSVQGPSLIAFQGRTLLVRGEVVGTGLVTVDH